MGRLGFTVWSRALLVVFGIAAATTADEQPGRASVWIDVYRGEPVSYGELLDDLKDADVVYLGERHTLRRHHGLQRRIVADLAAAEVPLGLALEQVEATQQSDLDRYTSGTIDFDELMRETKLGERWHNFEQYRPILEAARNAGAPIRALNARRETIRDVFRQGGVAKLPSERRRELPEKMQLADPEYQELLGILLGVHLAATPERMGAMIEAQIARDEHMAEQLVTLLKSPVGKDRTVIVLVGSGHVNYGLGLPSRVRSRMPQARDRIVIFSESGDVELTESQMAVSKKIEVTHEQLRAMDRPIADYLHVTVLKE
jgi:uncharacterized iron-regulated protein